MVSEQVMTGNVGDYNNHHPTLPKFECCEEMRGDIHEFASEYGYNTFMMGKINKLNTRVYIYIIYIQNRNTLYVYNYMYILCIHYVYIICIYLLL